MKDILLGIALLAVAIVLIIMMFSSVSNRDRSNDVTIDNALTRIANVQNSVDRLSTAVAQGQKK